MILTSQPNVVVNSGVHSALHINCHHQTVFTKFDLKIYFTPPYKREVWHYQDADTILTRRGIHEFNWQRALSNLMLMSKSLFFKRTILNILKNFIPHETIACDDKDPPWFSKRIKSLIQGGTLSLETFRKNRNNVEMVTCLNTAKQNYHP